MTLSTTIRSQYQHFMQTLQWCDSPLAAYYTDTKPLKSIGPAGGFYLGIEKPSDALSMIGKAASIQKYKREKFRCMFQFLMKTRVTGIPSVFDKENFGCPGCRFYLGFIPRLPAFNNYFTSTGFPGFYRGERYASCPQSSQRHARMLEGIVPTGRYLVFEKFETLPDSVEPDVVIFFANPEIICALVGLVRFVTDEPEGVVSPFGSGCASIFTWPIKYRMDGKQKAVLGPFDNSSRPYLPLAEMSLGIPYRLFCEMLGSYRKSFLCADTMKPGLIKTAIPGWPAVRKRAKRISDLLGTSRSDDQP
ncbi:MAG: DUF169 domain-containing protein [Chitinivibrionales bacterium]|nr:DUF169 domain-containing protein [Chitinivibrionales bacterium]